MINKRLQGKRNKKSGGAFELKVRHELENQGWTVCKWQNNIEFNLTGTGGLSIGKLIPAKRKYNPFTKFCSFGNGFPDFIAYRYRGLNPINILDEIYSYEVIGVEAKSNGYLDKEEKEKCRWLIDNHVFSMIMILSKGKKRGEIIWSQF